ncbi:RidA family protein [Nitrincola tapanii]|uniref:RidA family protein n=1 Tax=Nitrincola tapanii TaxID=1708751 RepID=A0A5A9W422_9GAMM|nr:RidA family protein [Nitrincola tapanii]KAA0874291.1 RidA family protein [Nitrincola tapanii]
MQIQRINPTQRWSDITLHNGVAYFVEVPEGELMADIRQQTRQLLAQVEASLARIQSDKRQILSTTIYLTDFAHLEGLNEVWDAWFEEGTAPSRACVKVELANPDWLVEMAFVAVAGDQSSL